MISVHMDKKDLQKLRRAYYSAPKQLPYAMAMWVNHGAFKVRQGALHNLKRSSTIRNESFLKSRLRVKKAKPSIMGSFAEVGSVSAPRFSGWAEQEGTKTDKRKKTITKVARGNSYKKRVRQPLRLKKGRNFIKPSDYGGGNKHARVKKMLAILSKERRRPAFIIKGHSSIQPGLYKYGSGAPGKRPLVPIQTFKAPKAPKKTRWLRRAVTDYLSSLRKGKLLKEIFKKTKVFKRR